MLRRLFAYFRFDLSQAAQPDDAGWERLQLMLLRRGLQVLLPLTGLLGAVFFVIGAPTGGAWLGAAVLALLLAVLQRWPGARRGVAWTMMLAAFLIMGAHVLLAKFVSAAVLAVLPGLAIFLDGLALGGLLFVGCAWLFAQLFQGAAAQPLLLEALVPAAGVGFFMLAASTGWYLGLRRARRLLVEAQAALKLEVEQRARLVQAIFEEVVAGQAQLDQALAAPAGPDWPEARRLLALEAERAEGLRALRKDFLDPQLAAPQGLDFSVPVLRTLMAVLLGMGLLAYFYLNVLGHGPAWISPLLVAITVTGLLVLRGKFQAPPWLAWLIVGVGVLIVGSDQLRDWGLRLAPTLAIGCTSGLNAALLLGWPIAFGLLGGIAVLGLAAGAALPAAAAPGQELAGLLFAFTLVGLIAVQAVVWQKAVLGSLEAERRRLALGLVQRRRLLGTLFHDIANPLYALRMTAELAAAGAAAPADLARCRRLLARLHELLQESRAWLLEGDGAQGAPPQPVAVDALLAGVNDLFVERLKDKHIALRQDVPLGLTVRAQAAALRDSVLSNLLSNAIKFSPAGSQIELQASRQGDKTCIEVRDHGPGLSADLRQRLKGGADLPSLAGTAGEAGHGLGLGLAQEHVKRMGGVLEFLEREGGGLVARVCLEGT